MVDFIVKFRLTNELFDAVDELDNCGPEEIAMHRNDPRASAELIIDWLRTRKIQLIVGGLEDLETGEVAPKEEIEDYQRAFDEFVDKVIVKASADLLKSKSRFPL